MAATFAVGMGAKLRCGQDQERAGQGGDMTSSARLVDYLGHASCSIFTSLACPSAARASS